MIITGDIFKFNSEDNIFTVTSVNPNGYVAFNFLDKAGSGFMKIEEFEKKCKVLVSELKDKKKCTWGNWKEDILNYYDCDKNEYSIPVKYRTNGCRIHVKTDWDEEEFGKNLSSHSSCHPDDKFNLNIGKKLAYSRLYAKLAKRYADEYKEEL